MRLRDVCKITESYVTNLGLRTWNLASLPWTEPCGHHSGDLWSYDASSLHHNQSTHQSQHLHTRDQTSHASIHQVQRWTLQRVTLNRPQLQGGHCQARIKFPRLFQILQVTSTQCHHNRLKHKSWINRVDEMMFFLSFVVYLAHLQPFLKSPFMLISCLSHYSSIAHSQEHIFHDISPDHFQIPTFPSLLPSCQYPVNETHTLSRQYEVRELV